MVSIFYNNIPFEEEDLTGNDHNFVLGRFMTAWSQVESLCGFLFRELAGLDHNIGPIIFDRVGTREQIEIVGALLENSDELAEHALLLEKAQKISVSRNKIVHAGWGKLDGEPARFWHGITTKHWDSMVGDDDGKARATITKYIFTTTDMARLTEECVSLRDELSAVLKQASQKKHEKWRVEHDARLAAQLARIPQYPQKR